MENSANKPEWWLPMWQPSNKEDLDAYLENIKFRENPLGKLAKLLGLISAKTILRVTYVINIGTKPEDLDAITDEIDPSKPIVKIVAEGLYDYFDNLRNFISISQFGKLFKFGGKPDYQTTYGGEFCIFIIPIKNIVKIEILGTYTEN